MCSHSHILTETDVCQWTGLSKPTMQRHRRDGTGPTWIQLSPRRIGYRKEAVEKWLAARENSIASDLNTVLPQPWSGHFVAY